MYILHIALGGCLTAPEVGYGLTEDTGGHIAYVLGAARAQAARSDVDHVDIVTRAFSDANLGIDHARTVQDVSRKLRILRLETQNRDYLAKEALAAEMPALSAAFHALLSAMMRKPDVIHAHFADAVGVALPVAKDFGIPVVYTPHSLAIDKMTHMDGATGGSLASRIASERIALTIADAVIVSSRDEAERQVEAYGMDVSGRVHRIAPGVTVPRAVHGTVSARALIDPLLDDPDRPIILAVARPVIRKNLIGLVRAYISDPDLQEAANLVILAGQRGPGAVETPESRQVIDGLMAEARRPTVLRRIALPQRHSPHVVTQLYRLAAERRGVFVNPALHEPFGLTLLEAARAGLPVVATREGGPVDILAALDHGRLVDPTDDAAIGAAIRGLLSDRVSWEEAARSGMRNIGMFDWTTWADGAQRVYRGLRPNRLRPKTASPARRLLACDIDGTLTGCPAGAERFRRWAAASTMPFVVATGRSISEARAVLALWNLPEPDAFVTAVGTEIHLPGAGGRYVLTRGYADCLDARWDRKAALGLLDASGLRMQPPVEQRRWKLACFGTARDARVLSDRFQTAGIPVRVVPSHGNLIDVLAPDGGKAAAIAFVARRYGLGLKDCIAAGDSGNDLDMLTSCGAAIVVANALPDLLTGLGKDRTVIRTCASYADGVLEGLTSLGLRDGRAVALPA